MLSFRYPVARIVNFLNIVYMCLSWVGHLYDSFCKYMLVQLINILLYYYIITRELLHVVQSLGLVRNGNLLGYFCQSMFLEVTSSHNLYSMHCIFVT